ncbi:MAG: zinc-dependent metalloprotease, partial [Bdellovibrio sp.]|nr:zinc-dependent metalloprotease [Bdellovibrio sp.]
DLKPLVVSFEKSAAKIAILAENYNSIYGEIKTVNLVQTFDVVSETETAITFNWGEGLKTFVIQSSYDVDGVRSNGKDMAESSFQSLPVTDSFVRSVKFDEKSMEIEQISKVRSDLLKASSDKKFEVENREETLAMNIQIRAYDLAPKFKAKEFDKSRRVGFFVTKVAKQGYSQEMRNLITKWDISGDKGPIQIRISSAVPKEYLSAVVEGALYWNKVFGKEAIEVVTGVDPQESPRDRSITVRWIPWLDSGAAYAMGQSDPLTGELLRAQVFMPSVFTRVGSADLVSLNKGTPVATGAVIACDLSESLLALQKLSQEASDSQRLRLALDSVRITVAHELGHALGLRHNFAGSYSAKVSATEIFESAKTYLTDLAHRGLETSTSVMDYTSGIDNILLAARIKYESLAYDKMVMDWAYSNGDQALNEKISLYCTDDDIAFGASQGLAVYGCERFDAGNNPLLRKYMDVKSEKDQFIKVLFTSIIGRLYPSDDATKVNDLKAVLADTVKFGTVKVADDIDFIGKALMTVTKNNQSTNGFASLDAIKKGEIFQAKFGLVTSFAEERKRSLHEIGGYSVILSGLWETPQGDMTLDWMQAQIEELKEASYFAHGKTLGGRDYTLSSTEQQQILEFFNGLVFTNALSMKKDLLQLLPKFDEKSQENGKAVTLSTALAPGLVNFQDAFGLGVFFAKISNMSAKTSVNKVGPGLAKEIQLPVYVLSVEERTTWARVLSSKGMGYAMSDEKSAAFKEQFNKISDVLKEIDATADLSSEKNPQDLVNKMFVQGIIDFSTRDWLNSEISLLENLAKIQ